MSRRKITLWLEFCVIYLATPLLLLVGDGRFLIPGLILWSAISSFLLFSTERFDPRKLKNWPKKDDGYRLALMSLMVLLISILAVLYHFPERLFGLPLSNFGLWLLIMLLYPPLSALPQEIVFRALYFERYREILPKKGLIPLNALIFMYAHIGYQSITVLVMTYLGGLIFARAYLREEFPLAVLLHSVAGNMIFTSGLGWLFCASCRS